MQSVCKRHVLHCRKNSSIIKLEKKSNAANITGILCITILNNLNIISTRKKCEAFSGQTPLKTGRAQLLEDA